MSGKEMGKAEQEQALEAAPPCPFCRGEEFAFVHGLVACWYVACMGCGARGPAMQNQRGAVTSWGQRAVIEAPA